MKTDEELAVECLDNLIVSETTMGCLAGPEHDRNRWSTHLTKGEAYTVILRFIKEARNTKESV